MVANNEKSDLIEQALNQALMGYEDAEEGDILVEWVLVAYVSNPDRKTGSVYPMLFSNGVMPDHHARGLLHQGLLQLQIETMFGGPE